MIKELEELIKNDKDLSPFQFDNYHGIKFSKLRKIAKLIAKEKRYSFFEEQHTTFEEVIIHSYAIGYLKEDISFCLEKVKEFIPQINSWAINDSLCQNMCFARLYQQEVFDFLLSLKDSKNEWERRIVAVTLLSHYLNDSYIDKTLEILFSIKTDTYMTQMGVAWAIATAMAKYPEKTLNYLKTKNIDVKTLNLAIRKSNESFRVSKENKELLNRLKKK